MLLGDLLVSVVILDIGNIDSTYLVLLDGKFICTTIGDMDILSLCKYYGIDLGSTVVNTDGKFDILLLCASLGSLDGLEVGRTSGTEL